MATEISGDSAVALNAKVVWVASDRIVLASSDSLAVEEWDGLQFLDRKKPVATGVVTRIYEPGLVGGRITSGSLRGVKKLDHIRVLASHPVASSPRLVRIGYPSARRFNALFRCSSTYFRIPTGYRSDGSDGRRFVRDAGPDPPWPDTLVTQEFDESADEEIAVERGDLDLAIFWPGELSSWQRERLNDRNSILAPLATGVVGACFNPSNPSASRAIILTDSTGLESANRDLFGGDLALMPQQPRTGGPSYEVPIQVDRSCPGWHTLEASLNKTPRSLTAAGTNGHIHVFYLGVSPDSSRLRIASAERSLDPTAWLYRMRAVLLFTPSLRRVLDRWHGEPLVDLLTCDPPPVLFDR